MKNFQSLVICSLIAVCVSMSFIGCSHISGREKAEKYYETGKNFYQEKRYVNAIDYFTKAIDLQKDEYASISDLDGSPYTYRAVSYMKLGRYDNAILDINTLRPTTPKVTAYVNYLLSSAYSLKSDPERACVYLEKLCNSGFWDELETIFEDILQDKDYDNIRNSKCFKDIIVEKKEKPAFEKAKKSNTVESYDKYLKEYPNGIYISG